MREAELMITRSMSFAPDDAETTIGPSGQVGHKDLVAHTARLSRQLYEVRSGVWCMVGNGLSNQTFIEAPEGLIVIDTGESVEEMRAALDEVRQHTASNVAAVIYTHFHYVAGTQALLDDVGAEIPIWGHPGIVGNLQRVGSEVSAAGGRGIVHQFGLLLPSEGPDATINVGLGLEFRSSDHAPFTSGFVPPTNLVDRAMSTTVAGLAVEFTLAPSDADDSITIWFPDLSLCVNNLVWPALYNVFPIRGEEYRDPRVLLEGLEHLAGLDAEYLVGAHGPPLTGREQIAVEVETYRDSIQFLWDQTVRGINRGLTTDELARFVQLPDDYGTTYFTRQFYGIAEHHVRQIHAGLRGWFDGDEAKLLPLAPVERAQRLIEGFGGVESVRTKVAEALDANDVRWAIEMASWLIHRDVDGSGRADAGDSEDRELLARALRIVAQRTTAANLRSWCLTRAQELEGSLDLARFRIHRFNQREVASSPPEVYVKALRVLLVPDRAAGVDEHLRFVVGDRSSIGLHVRRCVAVPTNGEGADLGIELDRQTWASILANKLTLEDALAAGSVQIHGDVARVRTVLGCFDLESLVMR